MIATVIERHANGPRLLYLSEMIPTMIVQIHPATYGGVESSCASVALYPKSLMIVGRNREKA
jgi:hypothetical protein